MQLCSEGSGFHCPDTLQTDSKLVVGTTLSLHLYISFVPIEVNNKEEFTMRPFNGGNGNSHSI